MQYMLFVASRSSIENDTLCCQIVYLRHVSAGNSANQLNPDLLPITFIENRDITMMAAEWNDLPLLQAL